ncbi:hydantoinase/oxoprolinase family protein [Candidatus Aminicenantes bacterium AC-335-G13]|nr:hydantoinase/oxoprolinase family protein [Candidatus Aminicenantes bacterium AC-335-G13]
MPEYREYERASTTLINAYVMPVVDRYLKNLESKIPNVNLKIMQSNEGFISSNKARKEAVKTILSGPAGGVVGAFYLSKLIGNSKIITFDMGGTSTDVSLIDNEIKRTTEAYIEDFPLKIPVIDIHTVGAGGGSIAYMDKGGALRVGPQSAGADPGPACYGKSFFPTVTDANLVLGRLDPENFLGGKMKIYPERSIKAIEKIAKKINKSIKETASGIIQIANTNMERAIRVISVERGYDPRNFALFSFGGAGGMHSVELAMRLKIPVIIIPKRAGVLSALGMLLSDSVKDYTRSILKIIGQTNEKEINRIFIEMIEKGIEEMREEGFSPENIKILRFLDLRYLGQSYEITIPYSSNYIEEFHRRHRALYSYAHLNRPIEIVNLRIKCIGQTEKIDLPKYQVSKKVICDNYFKKQKIYYNGKEYEGRVFLRESLEPGNIIKGPALIVDFESTAFVPPSYSAEVDCYLNLIIKSEQ